MSERVYTGEIAKGDQSSEQIDSNIEAKLSAEIAALWSAQKGTKAEARRTKEDLKNLRRKLGERLWQMKSLLARSGRGGQWTSYLRVHNIPRSSGDRCVREHEILLSPVPTNRTTGAFSEPTEADIKKFVERLLPRLRHALIAPESIYQFVREMVVQLPVADACVMDWGIEVYRPAPKETVAQTQEMNIPQPLSAVS